MRTQEYIEFIPIFLSKIENDGVSNDTLNISKWITNYFKEYCLEKNIECIDMEVISIFYKKRFGYNIDEPNCNVQISIRRPLLILMEYYNTGTYSKSYKKGHELLIPNCYSELYSKLKLEYINKSNLSDGRKKRKSIITGKFLIYLNDKKLTNIKNITINDVSEYIELIKSKYASESIRTIKGILRETLNWLYFENEINFTGNQVFPIINKNNNEKILTTYTEEEIEKILNMIDINSRNGKCRYAILSLLVYYGLRCSDIINLKFENIDFEKGYIRLVQQKTKNELSLPLIDEVKLSLIDYIKNERHNNQDAEYIFTTLKAPYTRIHTSCTIYQIVTKAMNDANIDYKNKKHGPHTLRHSLATNMLKDNIPLEDISSILGHENTSTTNIYITKDTTHLKELTLEI